MKAVRAVLLALLLALLVGLVIGTLLRRRAERPERYMGSAPPALALPVLALPVAGTPEPGVPGAPRAQRRRPSHSTSPAPERAFSTRASTKSRSDSRFR